MPNRAVWRKTVSAHPGPKKSRYLTIVQTRGRVDTVFQLSCGRWLKSTEAPQHLIALNIS